MSSFLDRFIGRTQTITKLGPEGLLKGREDNIIYTNTHKSFARSSTHQRLNPHHQITQEVEKEPEEQEEEAPFHLPLLQQRYINSDTRKQREQFNQQSNSRMHLDKETNWLIEEPEPAPQELTNPNRMIASVDPQKQNHGRALKEKDERRLKSHHLQKSSSRLGGLGANIGGEQWNLKKQKQQKMKKYAGELKRVHREKLQKDNGETVSSFSGHRMLINY